MDTAKQSAWDRLPVGPILTLVGLVLIVLPIFFVSPQIQEPVWSNTVPQSAIGTIPQRQITSIGIYAVALAAFYVVCWRVQRRKAILLFVLQMLSIPLLFLCDSITAFGGGTGTAVRAQVTYQQAEYMLVMRNIVGNGKLDLYRCIDGQCRGRMIAWDEWATYTGATLTIAGDPPQLVVEAVGKICFNLDDFDATMQAYVTRPEAGTRRDQIGWQDGCNPSNTSSADS